MDMDAKNMHGREDGMCMGMMGTMCGHHHWAHIIIRIIVAFFIFWCGVQFGELKASVHGGNMYYRSYGGPAAVTTWASDSASSAPDMSGAGVTW
jgi:hypothetical protein